MVVELLITACAWSLEAAAWEDCNTFPIPVPPMTAERCARHGADIAEGFLRSDPFFEFHEVMEWRCVSDDAPHPQGWVR